MPAGGGGGGGGRRGFRSSRSSSSHNKTPKTPLEKALDEACCCGVLAFVGLVLASAATGILLGAAESAYVRVELNIGEQSVIPIGEADNGARVSAPDESTTTFFGIPVFGARVAVGQFSHFYDECNGCVRLLPPPGCGSGAPSGDPRTFRHVFNRTWTSPSLSMGKGQYYYWYFRLFPGGRLRIDNRGDPDWRVWIAEPGDRLTPANSKDGASHVDYTRPTPNSAEYVVPFGAIPPATGLQTDRTVMAYVKKIRKGGPSGPVSLEVDYALPYDPDAADAGRGGESCSYGECPLPSFPRYDCPHAPTAVLAAAPQRHPSYGHGAIFGDDTAVLWLRHSQWGIIYLRRLALVAAVAAAAHFCVTRVYAPRAAEARAKHAGQDTLLKND